MANGLAQAKDMPEDTIDLMLGAVINPDGPRGLANLDVKLGHDIIAFARGEIANDNDWSASAGLKMRW